MEWKTVTIQTNTKKKGKLDQRSFQCHVINYGEQIIYAMKESRRDLGLKRFNLTEGCRIIDDGVCYPIQDIFYSNRPARPYLVVSKNFTI